VLNGGGVGVVRDIYEFGFRIDEALDHPAPQHPRAPDPLTRDPAHEGPPLHSRYLANECSRAIATAPQISPRARAHCRPPTITRPPLDRVRVLELGIHIPVLFGGIP